MGTNYNSATLCYVLLLAFAIGPCLAALVQEQPLVLKYHNGALLKGNITVNLIWYGKFTPSQRAIVVDFVNSLSSSAGGVPSPSAESWWRTTDRYQRGATRLRVGTQFLLEGYSLGRTLKSPFLGALARKGLFRNPINNNNVINVVLTASDVAVEGFCMNRCGSHGSTRSKDGKARFPYVWAGDSAAQCPGYCAWPFHQPIYGPQTPLLVSPNGDVGIDGMIINLATVLANAVTNPYNNGYFQGPATAPLEAVTACTGMFGTGSYPGYPGSTLVDKATGASYNAHGVNGRRFLLPAMWDPKTSACTTLV